MIICGIDEAGRGPVIGPLVISAVLISKEKEKDLLGIGVKDSKQIAPNKRSLMFNQIKKIADDYRIIKISPKEIDSIILSGTSNLNWLEADKSIEMINELIPDKVYIDCPSNNVVAYKNYIRAKLSQKALAKTELIAEHKADEKYISAGAASILAKVTRDNEIEKIKEKIGVDFGSGYPSDEKTQKFLKDNWDKYPEIFRKSWESYKKAASERSQKGLSDF